jgi:hypothetical protein
MNVKNLWKNARKGLSAPILALILLIVGVALTLVAVSIAGGFLFGWVTAPRVTVERVDLLVDPVSGNGFVTVDVRNSGGSPLGSCSVQILDGAGNVVTTTIGPTDLNPGQTGSYSANAINGIQSGSIYITVATCTGQGGVTVIDKKSAIAHI